MREKRYVENICERCGETYSIIQNNASKQRFCSRKCMAKSRETNITKKELYQLYFNDRIPLYKIGEKFGVSKTSIMRAMKRYGLESRAANETRMPEGYEQPSKEILNELYWVEWLSYESIGKKLNVDPANIPRWLKQNDIKTRTNAETRLGKVFVEPTKEELIDLYINQELPTAEIGKIFGCGSGSISRRLYQNGIEVRPNIFNGKHFLRCEDGHEVRSYYEKSFDNLLYRNDIGHEYEPRIPFDKRYASDFIVGDVYVEIWGVQNNKKYEDRRIKKTKLYKDNGLKLLEIYPEDFKNITTKLDELKRLIS